MQADTLDDDDDVSDVDDPDVELLHGRPKPKDLWRHEFLRQLRAYEEEADAAKAAAMEKKVSGGDAGRGNATWHWRGGTLTLLPRTVVHRFVGWCVRLGVVQALIRGKKMQEAFTKREVLKV